MRTETRSVLSRAAAAYRGAALLFANTVALFLAANLLGWIVVEARAKKGDDPVSRRYGEEAVLSAYPGKSKEEVTALLRETWSRDYRFEPFTQFRERPHEGDWINVTEEGYRKISDQAPWPPDPGATTVFVFGGSTLFGYGVADGETIPSYLQETLRRNVGPEIAVYNLGRGHYYSSQERIQFEQLLVGGIVPDVAVFFDGLNEFYYPTEEPYLSERFREYMEGGSAKRNLRFLRRLPVVRAILGDDRFRSSPVDESEEAVFDRPEILDRVLDRYFVNRKLIAASASAFGVTPVFVWQPVPTYRWDDASHHPFLAGGYGAHTYSRYGYRRMEARRSDAGGDIVWLADLQEGRTGPLYVDKVHYTAAFGREIAEALAQGLIERGAVYSNAEENASR